MCIEQASNLVASDEVPSGTWRARTGWGELGNPLMIWGWEYRRESQAESSLAAAGTGY